METAYERAVRMQNSNGRFYIKFEEGNKESLRKAIDKAKSLWYTVCQLDIVFDDIGNILSWPIDFTWEGLLQLDEKFEYFTSICTEEELQRLWYKEISNEI